MLFQRFIVFYRLFYKRNRKIFHVFPYVSKHSYKFVITRNSVETLALPAESLIKPILPHD